ncbi:hypothetical protein Taro_022495, partial [Colocasia esculenta]|nr:hypothetical protein [Colocasia esculenta]
MSLTTAQGWPCAAHLFGGYFSGRLAATQKLKTCVIRKDVNPEWNEDLILTIEDPAQLVKLESAEVSPPSFDQKAEELEKMKSLAIREEEDEEDKDRMKGLKEPEDSAIKADGFRDDSEQIMREVREAVLATRFATD